MAFCFTDDLSRLSMIAKAFKDSRGMIQCAKIHQRAFSEEESHGAAERDDAE